MGKHNTQPTYIHFISLSAWNPSIKLHYYVCDDIAHNRKLVYIRAYRFLCLQISPVTSKIDYNLNKLKFFHTAALHVWFWISVLIIEKFCYLRKKFYIILEILSEYFGPSWKIIGNLWLQKLTKKKTITYQNPCAMRVTQIFKKNEWSLNQFNYNFESNYVQTSFFSNFIVFSVKNTQKCTSLKLYLKNPFKFSLPNLLWSIGPNSKLSQRRKTNLPTRLWNF